MSEGNRLLNSLERNFGKVIIAALGDPEVVEIMVNPDGNIWIERLGEGITLAGKLDSCQGRNILKYMASGLDTVVTIENPIVEGELPLDGSRFEGLLPPVVAAPSFTIRKKALKIFSLDEYVANGILPAEVVELFKQYLTGRLNILVVGGTGSGKTTFVNALISELSDLCPDDRLIILEDMMELQSQSPNTVFFRTSDHVDMQRLLKATMRYRPDRILIGEVRDKTALDLLKAWNTGHPGGIATVHANSAEEGLDRLEELTEEAGKGPKYKLIGRSVNVIVFIQRDPQIGRRVTQVLKVAGYDPSTKEYNTEEIYNYDQRQI